MKKWIIPGIISLLSLAGACSNTVLEQAAAGAVAASSGSTSGTGGEQGAGGSDIASSSSSSSSGGEGGSGGSVIGQPIILVSLNKGVASGTTVKKTHGVSAVAFTVTASELAKLQSFTLTGQAQIGGSGCNFGEQCAREAFATRVISLGVFDGTTQIGSLKSPDPMTGKVFIDGVNVTLPKDSQKFFTVKVGLSSAVSISEPFDQIAIGFENPWDVVVLNENDESLLASIHADIGGQTGAAPAVVQTIRPSGILTIVDKMHPPSSLVAGGKDIWIPVAQFEASAFYEGTTIDFMRAFQASPYLSDNADVTTFAIASGGTIHGTAVFPDENSGQKDKDVELFANPIVIPADTSKLFQIWVKFASVLPSSAVNGEWKGVARSGHAPAFGLTHDLADGIAEWTAEYFGKLNVRATGLISGERMHADKGASPGNPMWLRKAIPLVNVLAPASTVLTNTVDQDLFRIQVTAAHPGSWITLKGYGLQFKKTVGMTFGQCRLAKGASLLPLNAYFIKIYDATTDSYVDTVNDASTDGSIIIGFPAEQMIDNAGFIYTLRCTNNGVTTGQSLTLAVDHAADAGFLNQSLTGSVADMGNAGFYLQRIEQGVPVNHPVAFLWSDLSEVPHSDKETAQGGSLDFINHSFAEILTDSITLTN